MHMYQSSHNPLTYVLIIMLVYELEDHGRKNDYTIYLIA